MGISLLLAVSRIEWRRTAPRVHAAYDPRRGSHPNSGHFEEARSLPQQSTPAFLGTKPSPTLPAGPRLGLVRFPARQVGLTIQNPPLDRTRLLNIVHFPYPTLRYESKPVTRVDAELKKMIAEMFELMYEANGVGLAANQVDLPLRFFVMNAAGKPDEGEEYVFINPVISRPKGSDEKEEGCLSIAGIYAPVTRPAQVHISAYSLQGEELEANLDGLIARVVQHETDHLDGVLFVDRLSTTGFMEIEDMLLEMQNHYVGRLERGETADDATVMERLQEWENRYASTG